MNDELDEISLIEAGEVAAALGTLAGSQEPFDVWFPA